MTKASSSRFGWLKLQGLVLGVAIVGCEKDEPPPPLPSAAPAASPEPPEELVLAPEVDAATLDAEEAPKGKGKGKSKGKAGSGSSLANCCAALEQNAANAPEPNAGYMRSAALACRSAAAAGQAQGQALAAIRAALQTAGMPTACK